MTTQHASPVTPTPAARPLTGEEYIESLRDGREVFIYGEKVADVTTHPAFRNSVRTTARGAEERVGEAAVACIGRRGDHVLPGGVVQRVV